ncbi:glutamate racemase [Candidatus Uhrbacteria bacterium]|nr:glutamate racemase [Candidatus Uhrbacteria bacterium]
MIGVFDSGIGGLTVMRELLRELPECGFVYLGDTARVPYGPKGPETIRRYSREGAELLLTRGAKLLVVACNTMSAVAAEDLRAAFPNIPIVEVVTPAVAAAVAATRSGRIGVIGTRATIASGVYEREIRSRGTVTVTMPVTLSGDVERQQRAVTMQRSPKRASLPSPDALEVFKQACPLLVPLVEEGWLDHAVTRTVVGEYLAPLHAAQVDTLILGCTHYPLLEPLIAAAMGEGVTIVNPARAVAREVRDRLERDTALASACRGTSRGFHFTDTTPHTTRLASEWLGIPVTLERVAVP